MEIVTRQVSHISTHTGAERTEPARVAVGVKRRPLLRLRSHPTKLRTRGIRTDSVICGKAEASCREAQRLARVSRHPDLGTA